MMKTAYTPKINAIEELTDSERVILDRIVRLADTKGAWECIFSDSLAEKDLGWSPRKTQRKISALKERGFVALERIPSGGKTLRKIIILDKTKAFLRADVTSDVTTSSRQKCRDCRDKIDVTLTSKLTSPINKENARNIQGVKQGENHTTHNDVTPDAPKACPQSWTLTQAQIRDWLRHNLAAMADRPESFFRVSGFAGLDPEYANLPDWLEENLDGAAACVLDLKYPVSYDTLAEHCARRLDRGNGDWRECVTATVRDELTAYARLHLDEIWADKYLPYITDAVNCHGWITGMYTPVLHHPLEAAVVLLDDGPRKYIPDVEFMTFMLDFQRARYATDPEAAVYLGLKQGDPSVPALLCAKCAAANRAWWEGHSLRLFGQVVDFDWEGTGHA